MNTFADLIPAPTTTLAQMKTVSVPFFNAFVPVAYVEIGIVVAVAVFLFIIILFRKTFSKLLGFSDYGNSNYNWTDDIKARGMAPTKYFNSKTNKFE